MNVVELLIVAAARQLWIETPSWSQLGFETLSACAELVVLSEAT
jgi:hypothetical protein